MTQAAIRYGLVRLLCICIAAITPAHLLAFGTAPEPHLQQDPTAILGYEENYLPAIIPFERRELNERIEEALRSDDTELLYRLGYMYQFGMNTKVDSLQAEEFYRKAAKLNHVPSMLALGVMYRLGDGASGMEQSILKARKWFKKASNAGSAYGDYEIALMYENGEGLMRSHKRAFSYMKKAEEGGVLAALIKMGVYHRYGIGVEPNLQQSVRYFKEFQKRTKDERAKLHVDAYLGDLYYYLAYDTPTGTEEELAMRFNWLRLAAHYGHLIGQLELATAYREGLGTAQDYGLALSWYERVAEVEHPFAYDNLGYLYSQGLGVKRDNGKAFSYYKKGAELGSANSAWGLGYLYYHGYGVKQDYRKAKIWFDRSKSLALKQGLVVVDPDEE